MRIGARHVDKARSEFPGAAIVELDFARPATLATAVKGVAAVFSATPFDLLPTAEQDLIAAAKSAGVGRFVKLSAMGGRGRPQFAAHAGGGGARGIGPRLDGPAADFLHAKLFDHAGRHRCARA